MMIIQNNRDKCQTIQEKEDRFFQKGTKAVKV